MREDLIGYLLGAMEPKERAEFERRLEADAELREELQFLAAALDECGDAAHLLDPPAGLARRTCEFIARVRTEEAALFFAAKGFPAALPREEVVAASQPSPARVGFVGSAPWTEPPAAEGRRWRIADVVTLAGLGLAASLLLFPALASWRYGQHAAVCREKLHRLGVALIDYSRVHGGVFPEVPESGPLAHAGVYAPRLMEAKLVNDISEFLCPGRPTDLESFAVPTLAKLRTSAPDEELQWARTMGGGYGYALGYVEEGSYRPLRNLNRATFAVLADVPDAEARGSLNHGCGGQNVLFEDGHTEFMSHCRRSLEGDDLFRNAAGFVGAGIGRDDSVIAPSEARPIREPSAAIEPLTARR